MESSENTRRRIHGNMTPSHTINMMKPSNERAWKLHGERGATSYKYASVVVQNTATTRKVSTWVIAPYWHANHPDHRGPWKWRYLLSGMSVANPWSLAVNLQTFPRASHSLSVSVAVPDWNMFERSQTSNMLESITLHGDDGFLFGVLNHTPENFSYTTVASIKVGVSGGGGEGEEGASTDRMKFPNRPRHAIRVRTSTTSMVRGPIMVILLSLFFPLVCWWRIISISNVNGNNEDEFIGHPGTQHSNIYNFIFYRKCVKITWLSLFFR